MRHNYTVSNHMQYTQSLWRYLSYFYKNNSELRGGYCELLLPIVHLDIVFHALLRKPYVDFLFHNLEQFHNYLILEIFAQRILALGLLLLWPTLLHVLLKIHL